MGAKITFAATGNLIAVLQGVVDQVEERYDRRLDALLIRLNELLLARTPVWEGDTIHNWRWSTRAPDRRHKDPVPTPGDPGPTSTMMLGEEPRRRANQTRPRQSLRGALRAKEPIDIFLTNTSPHAAALEAGLLPTPEGFRSMPGFLRLSIKEVFGGY